MIAVAADNAPRAMPAAAKEPVAAWTVSKSDSGSVAYDSRPKLTATNGRSTPGKRRTAR